MSRIVVLGGAESGVGAAVLAKVKGFDVFLSDKGTIDPKYADELRKWEIPFEQGQHTEELILNADEVVKSPGIPSTAPMVRKLEEKGTHIISEIEFAGRYDTAKKICITGSNGKTTTTSLIYYLLQNAGLNVGLGGNIGKSYAYQVATEHFDYYVLEISSFQLDNCYDFRPDIAIITNITPDHLDRYDYQMENYVKAKFRITRNLRKEDCFIFDSDDAITIDHLNKIIIQAKMLPFTQKEGVELKEGAFVKDEKGRPAAMAGKHDDLVMGWAITMYIRDQQATTRPAAKSEAKKWTRDMWEDYRAATPAQRKLLEAEWGRPG